MGSSPSCPSMTSMNPCRSRMASSSSCVMVSRGCGRLWTRRGCRCPIDPSREGRRGREIRRSQPLRGPQCLPTGGTAFRLHDGTSLCNPLSILAGSEFQLTGTVVERLPNRVGGRRRDHLLTDDHDLAVAPFLAHREDVDDHGVLMLRLEIDHGPDDLERLQTEDVVDVTGQLEPRDSLDPLAVLPHLDIPAVRATSD